MKIEVEHGMFARVTIPFEGPELFVRPGFGAVVKQGDCFTVLLNDGNLLVNPT